MAAKTPINSDLPVRQYHWIAKRIESLDPYNDYEEIYRLSSSYNLSEFMDNLIYGLVFPNFITSEWGSAAVWREDGGKVLHGSTRRMLDTDYNNMKWWYYGPSDERCLDSIRSINDLHRRLALKTPGLFSHNDDYIYTLAFSAVFGDRFRRRLGLSGFTGKQKISTHLFWQAISKHFVSEGNVSLHSFPADWDGMLRLCEKMESVPGPGTERGHLVAEAIYHQFAFRWFPPGLRWLGRAIQISLSVPNTLRWHQIEPVNPILAWLIVTVIGTLLWFAETLLPDPSPEQVFLLSLDGMTKEQKAGRNKSVRVMDKAFTPWFVKSQEGKFTGCPYHAAMQKEI